MIFVAFRKKKYNSLLLQYPFVPPNLLYTHYI